MHDQALHRLSKRILACIAALLMLSYAFSFSAIASVGYSSYASMKSEAKSAICKPISEIHSEDDLTDDMWIGIGSAEDLILMSKLINENANIGNKSWRKLQYRLTASIIFTEEQSARFVPIADAFSSSFAKVSSRYFAGVFDGCGFMIDELKCPSIGNSAKTMSYTSLFGLVGKDAVIQNLVIGKNCSFKAEDDRKHSCTASVASRVIAGATLDNLLNLAPVSGGNYSGGLVARIDITDAAKVVAITNCTNLGTVTGRTCVGGLVGTVRGKLQIENCVNGGTVTADSYAGGFFGVGDKAESADVWEAITVMMKNLTQKGSVIHGNTASGNFFGKLSNPDALKLTDVINCSYRDLKLPFAGEDNGAGLPDAASISVWNEEKDEVLTPGFHGLQLGSYEDGKLDIRLVGSITDDLSSYSEVGYLITYEIAGIKSEEKRCACKQVFPKLLAGSGSGMISYQAEQIRGENGYLYALTVTGVPVREGDPIVFTIQSYAKKADGTELLGNTGMVELTVTGGTCNAKWKT